MTVVINMQVSFDLNYHCSWGYKIYSWHSYNGLMTADVKANHMTV